MFIFLLIQSIASIDALCLSKFSTGGPHKDGVKSVKTIMLRAVFAVKKIIW